MVHVFFLHNRTGPAAARNWGVENAVGKIILLRSILFFFAIKARLLYLTYIAFLNMGFFERSLFIYPYSKGFSSFLNS